ncbi:putative metalloprotease CJM1_0395 family protein [Shewanella sp. HL-SH8]|uniref:putative metalloprotease CJM1_0395 family protein n=1 Tax=Shewanella sp. HL-SH8 TaxID=3436242 RepID=UPI003EB78FBB
MDIRQSSLPSNNFQPATSQSKQVVAVSASSLASTNLASISSASTIPSSSATSSASLAANVALTTAKPITKSTVTPTAAAVSQNVSPVLTPTAVKTASFATVSPINTSSAAANQNPSVTPTNSPSTISSNGFNLRTGASHIAAINPAQIAKPEVSQTSAVSVDAIQAVNIFATADPSETEPTNTKTDYQQLFQQQTQTESNVDVEKERINPFEDKTPPSQINTGFSQNAVSQSAVNQDANNRQQDAQVNGQAQQAEEPSTSEQAIAAEQQKQQQQAQEQQQQQASDQVEQQQQKVAQAEQQIISELSKRDIEVKTHEQAHKAVGGMFAQSPSFSYEKGPDGKRYAVDGEVQIDVGAVSGDPQATFNKMQKVYAAAMAPNQPSSADIRVAAEAVQKMNQAKAEMAELRQEKIIPAEDIQHINELANTYKQTDAQQNGFQQSQLAPFTLAEKNTATADAKSRFSQKMAESQDTRTPQVPLATLAYLQNQAVPNTSSTNFFMYDKSDQALAFSV